MNEVISSIQPNTTEKKPHEYKCTKNDKTAEYERLISLLHKEKNELIDANKGLGEFIDKLQVKIKEYENMPITKDIHEFNMLRDQRDQLQEENNRLTDQWIKADYRIENMKKRVEDLGNTLKLYEKENKLLRGLTKLWA